MISTATACGGILISRGVIYCRCACYAAASIAHGYASVTAASCALEAHETCLACRANGFGCAYWCSSYMHQSILSHRQLKFWLRVESLAHLALKHKRKRTQA